MGELVAGERHEGLVTLINRDDKPVKLIYSTSGGQGCFARVPREAVPERGRLAVPLVVEVAGTETGQQKRTIQLHTNHPYQRRLKAHVTYAAGPDSKGKTPELTSSQTATLEGSS